MTMAMRVVVLATTRLKMLGAKRRRLLRQVQSHKPILNNVCLRLRGPSFPP